MSDFERPGGSTPPPPPPGWGGASDAGPTSPGFGTPPPPPPPTYGSPPPYGSPSYGQVPTGYVAYGQVGAPVSSPKGLRTATIVLFWVATGVTFLVGILAYARGTTLDEFFNGDGSLQDVDDADSAVNGVAGLLFFVMLAAIIVLCLWSLRTVRNAKQRDPSLNVSPGLACGSWYIPIGNFWLPWQQLRRAGRRFATLSSALTVWQAMVITALVLNAVGRALGNVDDVDGADDAVGRLHAQGVVFLALGIVFTVATIFAMKATKEIDAATSGTA